MKQVRQRFGVVLNLVIQRRGFYKVGAESVEQVLSKATLPHHGHQVGIGCGNNLSLETARRGVTHALKHSRL